MEDEKKTAEETGATPEVGSDADTHQNTETVNDAEFTDSNEGGQAQPKPQEQPKPQTREQNSENARRRREAETKAAIEEAAAKAREQAIIETLGGKNPYTNEEMKDHADVEEYLAMKEIERNGGDPLADFSKFQKQKERERAAQAEERAREEDWYKKDLQDFTTKHPEANVQALIQNPQFQKFASGKVGNLPLSEIYEGFIELTSEYEKQAQKRAAQLLANQKASPGALSGTNTPDSGFFTREQVQKMTPEEVHKNYDKIRASMPKWK